MTKSYQASGVDIEKGYESVERIKKYIHQTKNLGMMASIGSFGGLFDLSKYNVKEPVLVSGTDGVGTKLLLAQKANKHDTIGIDLVAMCVNDVLCIGAKPLFFLDYIAIGKNDPVLIEQIVKGITKGLKQADVALIGGETAEMPDMYDGYHYDLAGFTTGVVEKSNILNVNNCKEGDILLGLPSSGLHSNGYSLVRKILFKDHSYDLNHYFESLNQPLIDALLTPTKIYVKGVLEVLEKTKVHGISHITGGGFIENIPRALPDHLGAKIYTKNIPKLPIFEVLKKAGNLEEKEMYNIFNMGIGMVLIIPKESLECAMNIANKHGYQPVVIGEVVGKKGLELV
jgi:phosphoribosylformylglycinamidine cyclo-ligase